MVGKVLLIFLGILPALVLLADIRAFAVNVPFMDDWQFVPLLEKAKNGTLTFQELCRASRRAQAPPATHHHYRFDVRDRRRLSRAVLHYFRSRGGHFALHPLADDTPQWEQE